MDKRLFNLLDALNLNIVSEHLEECKAIQVQDLEDFTEVACEAVIESVPISIYEEEPNIPVVQTTSSLELDTPPEVEAEVIILSNRDILINKLLNMNFIVNGQRLNSGCLFDFRYEKNVCSDLNIDDLLSCDFLIVDDIENDKVDISSVKESNVKKSIIKNIFKRKKD